MGVVAGDLVDTLSSPGPFTVFAPENKAFAGLPDGTLDTLLKPENKGQLVDILTYHVLPAQVLSTDLKPWQRVATVEGSTVDVVPAGNQVLVLDSNYKASVVISADNLATNGVAHIINGVLMPPAKVIPGPRKTEPTQNIVELAHSVHQDLSLFSPQPMMLSMLCQRAHWTLCSSQRTRINWWTFSPSAFFRLKYFPLI